MSDQGHIAHLYAFPSDGRLMLLGSKPSLEKLAAVIRALAPNEERHIQLTVAKMRYDGPSLPLLVCARNAEPLVCRVGATFVSISGNDAGLDHFVSSLDARSAEWFYGGHSHIYPGQDFSDGREGYLVSPECEEILIGGCGYIDDALFGLPDQQVP